MVDGVPQRNRILERTSEVGAGTRALAGSVGDLAEDLRKVVRERLRGRPYLTLGAAAACGYVLGGGLPRVLTRLAFAFGARVVLAQAIGAAIQPREAAAEGDPALESQSPDEF